MSQDNQNIVKIVDSVWCRTLCVLERVEMATGSCAQRTTLCHDMHPDREKPTQSASDIESEFEIQLLALEKAKAPIKTNMQSFAEDLKGWLAGRTSPEKSRVDELALILLKCLSGESGQFSSDDDDAEVKTPNVQGGTTQLVEDPLKHIHHRGDLDTGLNRFSGLFPEAKALFEKIAGKSLKPE